jgi:hypothetical protein
MGLFSSSSSSETKNIVDEVNTNNVDNRVTDGDGNIGGNISVTAGDNLSDLSIVTTDFGALDTAEGIANKAFDLSQNAFTSSQSAIKKISADAIDVARDITTDNTAKTIQYGIIAAAFIGAVAIYVRMNR